MCPIEANVLREEGVLTSSHRLSKQSLTDCTALEECLVDIGRNLVLRHHVGVCGVAVDQCSCASK